MNERTTQRLIYVAVALIALTLGVSIAKLPMEGDTAGASLLFSDGAAAPSCNVAVVKLQGGLSTYGESYASDPSDPNAYYSGILVDSESIVAAIEAADASSSIDAIVLQIDSTGGSPVAAEEIEGALKRTAKPTVALIRGEGLSAAYWAATGANIIVAAENAEVGSIGVTSSYLDQTKHDTQSGYTFHSISTGEYKDMLNPSKALTSAEDKLIRDEIAVILDNFVRTVSHNRDLAVASITPDLASGAPFTAPFALAHGLINRIGDKESVRGYLSETLRKPKSEIIYCP